MDIVALVLGMLTAGVGVGLLARLNDAGRQVAEADPTARAAPTAKASAATPQRHPARPGLYPLLEFFHPVLAVAGLACWFGFVYARDHAFASAGFWVLAVTIVAGLSLLVVNMRAAERRRRHDHDNPPAAPVRLILLHGLGAVVTLTLVSLIAFQIS